MAIFDQHSEHAFYQLFSKYLDLENSRTGNYSSETYKLDRMGPLAELAGSPERYTQIIHVAGTKGKGTTSFYIGELLRSSGEKCGTFTSPHLRTIRERFLVNGYMVTYSTLLSQGEDLSEKIEKAGLRPTFFEILTVLALKIFVAEGCRYTILETGIGGMYDATNFVSDPDCAVITRVSMDHVRLLGPTIREIAAQKAGIIKSQKPVVLSPQKYSDADRIIRNRAGDAGAPLYPVETSVERAERWGLPASPSFLVDNFSTALTVCRAIAVEPERAAFRVPAVPGRFEILRREPLLLIDAAHNADSAERLAEALMDRFPEKYFTVIAGVVEEKDAEGILNALQALPARFIFTHPLSPRGKGSQLDHLCDLAAARGLVWDRIPAVSSLKELPAKSDLVFTGSFFTALIGEQLLAGENAPLPAFNQR